LSVTQFLGQLRKWFQGLPEDPGRWTFGNLKRQKDGSFPDASLVDLLTSGSENVAGIVSLQLLSRRFLRSQCSLLKPTPNVLHGRSELITALGAYGARNIPKVMKVIEMLGIQQGRQWGLATLNEFRLFFKLKPYSTFGG